MRALGRREAPGDVRRRLSDREEHCPAHLRPCPSVARKPGEAARAIQRKWHAGATGHSVVGEAVSFPSWTSLGSLAELDPPFSPLLFQPPFCFGQIILVDFEANELFHAAFFRGHG